ncbi:MAG: hypothetical protein HY791_27870 [Deltaproteobacteria bacterium]|nr:hypothetical protein [Deltaproteobacteria bacterium]
MKRGAIGLELHTHWGTHLFADVMNRGVLMVRWANNRWSEFDQAEGTHLCRQRQLAGSHAPYFTAIPSGAAVGDARSYRAPRPVGFRDDSDE